MREKKEDGEEEEEEEKPRPGLARLHLELSNEIYRRTSHFLLQETLVRPPFHSLQTDCRAGGWRDLMG